MTKTPAPDVAVSVEQCDRQRMVLYEGRSPVPLSPDFARAILAGEHDNDERVQAFARHRLAALAPAEGEYVLVPREPTEAMLVAGARCRFAEWREHIGDAWSAMLAAAPPPPTSEPGADVDGRAREFYAVECERDGMHNLARRVRAGEVSGLHTAVRAIAAALSTSTAAGEAPERAELHRTYLEACRTELNDRYWCPSREVFRDLLECAEDLLAALAKGGDAR